MVICVFGDRLKKLRKKNKLTQEELGKILNVAKSTVSSWESGISDPPYNTLKEIAKLFCISTDYLLGINIDSVSDFQKCKSALKNMGMLNEKNGDMTEEDLKKALKIIEIMKNNK